MPAVMNSHIGALDDLEDSIAVLHRSLTTDIRVRTRAETLGDVAADLQRRPHPGTVECLCIRVGANEIDAVDTGVHHVSPRRCRRRHRHRLP